VLILCKNISL